MSASVDQLPTDLKNEAAQLLTEISARVTDALAQNPIEISRRLVTSLENRVKELDQVLFDLREEQDRQRRREAKASRGSRPSANVSPATSGAPPA